MRIKICEHVLRFERANLGYVETINAPRESPQKVKGQTLILDRETVERKLAKKGWSGSPKAITLALKLNVKDIVLENARQRVLKFGPLEVILASNNALLLSTKEKKLYRKSGIWPNQWHEISLTFGTGKLIVLGVDSMPLITATDLLEEDIDLSELISSPILLGGHCDEQAADENQTKSKNTLEGFIKDVTLTLSSSDYAEPEKTMEEAKSEQPFFYQHEEFHFIHSLYELATFNPAHHLLHRATVPLRKVSKERDRKVLICHDIPSGLCEEKLTQGLYRSSDDSRLRCVKQQANWYRFNHWAYIDVFVYFGHYTVTIPPPGFTNIAHQHGVKMLGTLIFEWDAGAREAKLMLNGKQVLHPDVLKKGWKEPKDCTDGSRFYARKLSELARHYGFDGYLMNFECKIKDTDVLLEWLEVLREELRKLVPHGLVIWYDSVLHDGQLRWQSALNEKNYRFFNVTDGFFTDYHWKLENLDVTQKAYNDYIASGQQHSTWDIYYGNDTYGRGTYGGGQLDIYKALNEIKRFPYSISLFGQALWYERHDGCQDLNAFRVNEELFWRGRGLTLIADSSGKVDGNPKTKDKLLRDWQCKEGEGAWRVAQTGDEFSTIASYQICTKKLCVSVEDTSNIKGVLFLGKVKGTGPDFTDAYRCHLRLEDSDGNELLTLKHGPLADLQICKTDGSATQIQLEINFTQTQREELLPKLSKILVIEEGRDAEYWAGHFGAQFSSERLYLEFDSQPDKNLHSQFQARYHSYEAITTSFNLGFGSSYFLNGEEVLKHQWANINEYDASLLLPSVTGTDQHASIVNMSAFHSKITTDGPHYLGGSSLKISGPTLPGKDAVFVSLMNATFKTPSDIKVVFRTSHTNCIISIEVAQGMKLEPVEATCDDQGWCILEAKNVEGIERLGIVISNDSESSIQVDVRIGLIAVVPSDLNKKDIPSQLACTVESSTPAIFKGPIDNWLEWTPIETAKYYRIWRSGTFLGHTLLPYYLDAQLSKETKDYRVEAISHFNQVLAQFTDFK